MANSDWQDLSLTFQDQIKTAINEGHSLRICGSGSKVFLGPKPNSEQGNLSTTSHRGILNYQPSELVLTARAGTPLSEIGSALAEQGQSLRFDPPQFGQGGTLGGAIASGLSGPDRVSAGAARDHVLGVRILNGRGESLRFGGEVMKNVAGYDVSRLMTGAFGTLGLLLDISVKTLPKPLAVRHLRFECATADALNRLQTWAQQPHPISASCYLAGQLHLKLAGAPEELEQCQTQLGGEPVTDQPEFWTQLRDQQWPFFDRPQPLWRLSLPAATPVLNLKGDWLYEWHGAQRWLVSDLPAETIRTAAAQSGGHATLYRQPNASGMQPFQPLDPGMLALHRRIKTAFDPHGVFNPGWLRSELTPCKPD